MDREGEPTGEVMLWYAMVTVSEVQYRRIADEVAPDLTGADPRSAFPALEDLKPPRLHHTAYVP